MELIDLPAADDAADMIRSFTSALTVRLLECRRTLFDFRSVRAVGDVDLLLILRASLAFMFSASFVISWTFDFAA